MATPGKGYFLQFKSEAFASRIVKMYQFLQEEKKEFVMSKQVLRSGTSIGANIAESKNAQSVADYISKLSIALKEAEETKYWITTLHEGGYINNEEFLSIHNDSVEMVKLLVCSIKKVKDRNGLL